MCLPVSQFDPHFCVVLLSLHLWRAARILAGFGNGGFRGRQHEFSVHNFLDFIQFVSMWLCV